MISVASIIGELRAPPTAGGDAARREHERASYACQYAVRSPRDTLIAQIRTHLSARRDWNVRRTATEPNSCRGHASPPLPPLPHPAPQIYHAGVACDRVRQLVRRRRPPPTPPPVVLLATVPLAVGRGVTVVSVRREWIEPE